MKLALGTGYERLNDYITVDINPNCGADVVCDVRNLPDEWTAMFEEIRAVDIWEHLPYRDTIAVLMEWTRVLAPDGRIYLQVPAADVAIKRFVNEPIAFMRDFASRMGPGTPKTSPICYLQWHLLGGQDDGAMARAGDDPCWNLHMALFDEPLIRLACSTAGLVIDSLDVNAHPNYCVWASKL